MVRAIIPLSTVARGSLLAGVILFQKIGAVYGLQTFASHLPSFVNMRALFVSALLLCAASLCLAADDPTVSLPGVHDLSASIPLSLHSYESCKHTTMSRCKISR